MDKLRIAFTAFVWYHTDIENKRGSPHTEVYTMKKEFKSEMNAYRFAATTTQEELAGRVSACGGMVCKFNDHVLVVNYCWCGFVAGVYKFTETPEETGLSECECRLALCEKSEGTFEDGGHAMAWALSRVH